MRTTANGSELLDVEAIGYTLGCGRTTVFRLIRERAFPTIKVGRQRLAAAADVDAYLRSLRAS